MNILVPMSEPEARLVVACLRGVQLLVAAGNAEASNQGSGVPEERLRIIRLAASELAPALVERIDKMLDRKVES